MPKTGHCLSSLAGRLGAGVAAAAELCGLHSALLRGEPGAADRLAAALLPMIMQRLHHEFSDASAEYLLDAAHDALVGYLARPDRYSSDLSRLDVYVARCAGWRLRNLRRRERRAANYECLADETSLAQASVAEDMRRARDDARRHRLRDRLFSLVRSADEQCALEGLLAIREATESRDLDLRLIRERLRSRARRGSSAKG